MIWGIGCDIIAIDRIKKAIDERGQRFLDRIFTPLEIEKAHLKGLNKVSYFAKRFSAKEAIAKALRSGIGNKFSFKDCQILNDKYGTPFIQFLKPNLSRLTAHISLSDENNFALAFVIIKIHD